MKTKLHYLRFYRYGKNIDSTAICNWLNRYNASHYWRATYTLVEFERVEDAAAFKLAFDLQWIPDWEIRQNDRS